MDQQATAPIIEDRVVTRTWELDLSLAGKVYSPKKRPTKHRRQQIARFVGREGTIERFEFRQTIPYPGHEAFSPPTQAQYGAVMDFYLECCETRYQANGLLSVRDYAAKVASDLSFTAPRWHFIWLCTAAFILADTDLRSRVRAWDIASYSKGHSDISVGIADHRPYKVATKFAYKLIDDMRAQGAQIFG